MSDFVAKQKETAAALAAIRIVPVLALEKVEDGLKICQIFAEQGLPGAEITFRTKAAPEVIREVYPSIPKISVDYGIMERAKGVLMLEGDFGWSDVGSFDSLDSVRQKDGAGNISSGETLLLDARNCVVYGTKKLIAAVGVEDLVIAEGDSAILVCPISQAQRVKQVVEQLEKEGRDRFL